MEHSLHEHHHEHEHEHGHHHPAGTEHASILSGACCFLLKEPAPLGRIADAASDACSRLSLYEGSSGEPLPGHIKAILSAEDGARCSVSSTIRGEANTVCLSGWDPERAVSSFRSVVDIILLTEEHPDPERYFDLLAGSLPVTERRILNEST